MWEAVRRNMWAVLTGGYSMCRKCRTYATRISSGLVGECGATRYRSSCCRLALCAWCLVLGAWCLVPGAWCLGHGASAVGGRRSAVGGRRSAVSGQRSAVSGQRSAVSEIYGAARRCSGRLPSLFTETQRSGERHVDESAPCVASDAAVCRIAVSIFPANAIRLVRTHSRKRGSFHGVIKTSTIQTMQSTRFTAT